MINKIKDKQTGEYHDIGGLKCKLVAEGTLEYVFEEGANNYKPLYNFEEGKTYFIFVDVDGEAMQFIGTFYQNLLRTQYVFDWMNDKVVCLVTDLDKYTYIFDSQINWADFYNGCPYKVYELPFALEV